jgi:hypothetical protein
MKIARGDVLYGNDYGAAKPRPNRPRRRPRSRNPKRKIEDEGREREICAGCEKFEG